MLSKCLSMSVSSYSPVVQSLGDAASYKKNITICEILVQVQSNLYITALYIAVTLCITVTE